MASSIGTLFLSVLAVLTTQTAPKTVWDGAYTSAQAERGQKAYAANCARCHQSNLGGKGEVPALKGDNFMERWHDYSVKPLFNMIKTEMPPLRFRTPDTKPLADDMYVDIISYILQANSFPAGSAELTVDTLDHVQIVGNGGAQPPPQFALVLSFGCMTYRPVSWTLTRATNPVRATMPDVAMREEIESAKSGTLGLRQYRLADFGYLGRADCLMVRVCPATRRPKAVASAASLTTPAMVPFIPTITASAQMASACVGGTYSFRIRARVSLHSAISSAESVSRRSRMFARS